MELPAELLVKVGTYTNGKTINSMSRASRRFNGIVESNRMTLPKTVVDLHVNYKEDSRLIHFMINVWSIDENSKVIDCGQPKKWFHAKLLEGDSNETDEQKRKLVAQFYEESAAYRPGIESFSFGLSYGLELHLDYILQKAHFNCLSLSDLTIEQYVLLYRQLQRYRSKVEYLFLLTRTALPLESVPPANMVKKLVIDSPPQGFYRLPSVRQLNNLTVNSSSDTLLDDGDFCGLRAADMIIDGGCKVTERGIRTFITQWCEGKREIGNVDLTLVGMDFVYQEDYEVQREKWLKMAESLNPELVRMGGEADREKNGQRYYPHEITLILLRLSDGLKLILAWDRSISLFSPRDSDSDSL